MRNKKIIIWGISVLSIIITAIVISIFALMFLPLNSSNNVVDFKVKWGDSISGVSSRLEKENVISNRKHFIITAKILGATKSLKTGLFPLNEKMSPHKALTALTKGEQKFIKVTLPEGYPSRKYAEILSQKLDLNYEKFIALFNDPTFIKDLGIDAKSLEGYLYPETYYFTYGLDEKQTVKKIVKHFNDLVNDSLRMEINQQKLSLAEILTLASIIEGEAMIDSEMVYISSVYRNRLKKRIRLQADPTIQYIIPDGPRRLLYKDLEIDSPYNTYKYCGLPPGPINNPSIKAIKAAISPAKTSYLYFVANGDGSHTFSRSLAEHNRAKQKFNKIRRRVAREKRGVDG